MRRIIGLSAFFSIALLTVLGVWFFSDHQQKDLAQDKQDGLQAHMDQVFADDVSYTVRMFMDKMEDQLIRWAESATQEDNLSNLQEEIHDHPHFHGFAVVHDNGETTKVGKVTENPVERLTKEKKEGVYISEPYVENGTQKLLMGTKDDQAWCIGEMDLSFVSSFVKDLAVITGENGQFFLGASNMAVDFDAQEAEAPYVKTSIPDLDWDVFVHSEPTKELDTPFKQGEVVVRIKDGADAKALAEAHQAALLHKEGNDCLFRDSSRSTDQLVSEFAADPGVIFAEPNYSVEKQTSFHKKRSHPALENKPSLFEPQQQEGKAPNDELYDPYQWNLEQITIEEGWQITSGNAEIPIAIIDSGVDPEHVDLEDKITGGYNAFEDNGNYYDEHGHGTHVAGVAAAITNNVEGIAGVSWENPILAVKALDANAEGNSFSIAEAIRWSVDNGARVINMSLGDSHDSEVMRDAVRYAYEQDVVLIAASGNEAVETPMYPAAYPEVFTVAALDPEGQRAAFSNFGTHVDVSAPGEHIPSTYIGNEYVAMSGTSMASPHVAGLAGLILSINPGLSNEEVYDIMRNSCDDIGNSGFDAYTGHGVINVTRAINMAGGE
ncbi:peptidase S8 [Bacillus sp. H-16]|uniref:S8 family peptidase n=1 Tax=Alteribacter salitolerans TaxID=2912333 RepID=UPI001965F6A9|nr:S8 family peptidase [Alteribacter salitolerans]MBM7094567.1 peptidase S8 [Alteribacter salitolerans]